MDILEAIAEMQKGNYVRRSEIFKPVTLVHLGEVPDLTREDGWLRELELSEAEVERSTEVKFKRISANSPTHYTSDMGILDILATDWELYDGPLIAIENAKERPIYIEGVSVLPFCDLAAVPVNDANGH